MAGASFDDIEVVCLSGLDSRFCSRRLEASLQETSRVVDSIDHALTSDRGVLIVSTGFRGFSRLLAEIEELGRNPFLVEITAVTEAMLSGLDLDNVILYHLGLMHLTMGERRSARKVYPPVTRRQLLRSLFIVKPFYAIQPGKVDANCVGLCPYEAVREDGSVDAGRCRGCMLCRSLCGSSTVWTGASAIAYTYKFVEANALDGVVFTCRKQLDLLDEKAVEASPARLALHPVPCISWLRPELLQALEKLSVPVFVLVEYGRCGGCIYERASSRMLEELRRRKVRVVDGLSEASVYAFTGYSRPRRSPEEVAAVMEAALGSND